MTKSTKLKPITHAEGRYRVTLLRSDLIEADARLWRPGYPELHGSPHEFLLDPDQYQKLVAPEDRWPDDGTKKVYCMSVVEEIKTCEVISGSVLTKFERNLQVEFSFVATLPGHRLQHISDKFRYFTRSIAQNPGAEYFTTFCETWHDITQKWCLKGGWKIAGIFPGNFVRWNERRRPGIQRLQGASLPIHRRRQRLCNAPRGMALGTGGKSGVGGFEQGQ